MQTGPATQDVEVVAMLTMLDRGQVYDLNDRRNLQLMIENRKEAILAGLDHPTAKRWTKELQEKVEPLLRMRFDARQGFVIDRWIAEEGYWHQIPGTCGFEVKPGLCERMIQQYDMWKQSTPREDQDAIHKGKRHPRLKKADEQSNKVIAENERKSTEKVMAAVDSLSSKRIENFVAVERARHTGEKIVHHGPDLKFVERLEKAEKDNPAPPEDMGPACGNPGMNPRLYKRAQGGKHVRER